MRTVCRLLEELLNDTGHRDIPAEERKQGEKRQRVPKRVRTVVGDIRLYRDYYYDGRSSRIPLDKELGIDGLIYSPGVQCMMARAAARSTFEEGHEDLKAYARLDISAREIQRMINHLGSDMQVWLSQRSPQPIRQTIPTMYISYDGTGAPMVKKELEAVKGKKGDGKAKTREVKLGCVFTQHTVDKEGHPIRDHESTTYVASFEQAEGFVLRLRKEAEHRGLAYAKQVVILGDGAAWIWKQAAVNFPGAIEILDIYHAYEHLHKLFEALFPAADARDNRLVQWRKLLKKGRIDKVLDQAKAVLPHHGSRRTEAKGHIEYFGKHVERMRYDQYQKAGLFMGSGVVEAGCKTVVGKRIKQSGMFWTERGATHVLCARCILLSRCFDKYWACKCPPPDRLSEAA